MRWENPAAESAATPAVRSAAAPRHDRSPAAALFGADAVTTRTFDVPEFAGITFHEIRARTILDRKVLPPTLAGKVSRRSRSTVCSRRS